MPGRAVAARVREGQGPLSPGEGEGGEVCLPRGPYRGLPWGKAPPRPALPRALTWPGPGHATGATGVMRGGPVAALASYFSVGY